MYWVDQQLGRKRERREPVFPYLCCRFPILKYPETRFGSTGSKRVFPKLKLSCIYVHPIIV